MNELRLTPSIRDEIRAHAADCYPDECCGIIIDATGVQKVVRVSNVQNERHARDPVTFPRTARTAYTMGSEAVPILLDAERGHHRIHAFYHSHPDHDSYFSAEDRAAALGGWEEPNYPDAGQIVMAVRDRVVGVTKAFVWDEKKRDFAEIALIVE